MQKVRVQEKKGSRWIFFLIIAAAYVFYQFTQELIGSVVPDPCSIGDRLQALLSNAHAFLLSHPGAADFLIAFYSLAGDLALLFFLGALFWTGRLRFLLPLVAFLFLRQLMQAVVTLPLAQETIWRNPGFPSLFASYNSPSVFYFSAYAGLVFLVALELRRLKAWTLSYLVFGLALAECLISLALRSHYTTDLYTSLATALFVFLYVAPAADRIRFNPSVLRPWLFVLVLAGAGGFYFVQGYIERKPLPACGIGDWILQVLLPLNRSIGESLFLSNFYLAVMNGIADLMGLFIIAMTLIRRDLRPFLVIFIFGLLRQTLQYLVSLPVPPYVIWHDPGFPTIFSTYHIANDLYFSLHTGVSLVVALEMARFKNRGWLVLGLSLFFFEAFSVLLLHAHYTMDVFTAIVTVFILSNLCVRIAPPFNRAVALFTDRLRS